MCFDKRVLIGLGAAALALFALSPRLLGAAAPLLIMAACPLSMVFMMRRMAGPDASCEAPSRDADRRELEEEVNRLRAEAALRDQTPSA